MIVGDAPVIDERLDQHVQDTLEETAALDFCFGKPSNDKNSLHALKTVALSGKSRLARLMLSRLASPNDPTAPIRPGPLDCSGRLHCASAAVLATVLGTQPLEPWHRRRALELYDRLVSEGNEIVNSAHQGMHVQLMHYARQTERLRETLMAYRNIDRLTRRALEAELEFPGEKASPEAFLLRFQRFAAWADLRLGLRDGDAPLFDRIELNGLAPVHGGQRISVIMTCYEPGPELLTAVRSVRAQSWQNWELLLVDDASGPEYGEVLSEAAAIDPRVRVIRRERNGGTYAARNDALKTATGVFVTGIDSDDWAHPRWLEAQVEPLTRSREVRMTCSEGIRATSDLRLIVSPGRQLTEVRSTSIMYRRAEVHPELGYFDGIRKSADSEFRFRLVSRFGAEAVRFVPGRYTMVRQHEGTLSKGEIGEGWLHPARFAYESSFRHWHAAIRSGADNAYLGEEDSAPLYAPRRLADPDGSIDSCEHLYVADWRTWSKWQQALVQLAADAVDEGRVVAFAHYSRPWAQAGLKNPIVSQVLEFAREHGIEFVDPADIEAARVIVADQQTREALRYEFPDGIGASAEAIEKGAMRRTFATGGRSVSQKSPLRLRTLLAIAIIAGAGASAAALFTGVSKPLGQALAAGGLAFLSGAAVLAARRVRYKLLEHFRQ